jgi:hypothetical protein
MTFTGLTQLQEQSRNAAHTSAIMHMVETNGWNQLDHSCREITARNGLGPEIVKKLWIPSGDGLRHDMDHYWIWTDDRRWITGDG